MSTSENIFQRIRMFVTDADGTLLGHRPEFEQYRAFRLRLEDLQKRQNAYWVVCTGRSLRGFTRVFLPMRAFGIVPDFVIARHAYIYEKTPIGYKPHWMWNMQVLKLQWQDEWRVRRAIPRICRAVLSRNPFARVTSRSGGGVRFRFDDDGSANFGAEILRQEALPYKNLQVFHHLREVDVRRVPFTKGLAVTELARHLGVTPDRILVVGDGHNDISMMEMHPDIHTACPSNAVPEVIETVHRTHGHIASSRSLGGIMEAIAAYESGEVNDKLPATWLPSNELITPPRRSPDGKRGGVFGFVLFLAVLYTTMVALASFDVMPFGRHILAPYQALLDLVTKAIAWFRH